MVVVDCPEVLNCLAGMYWNPDLPHGSSVKIYGWKYASVLPFYSQSSSVSYCCFVLAAHLYKNGTESTQKKKPTHL